MSDMSKPGAHYEAFLKHLDRKANKLRHEIDKLTVLADLYESMAIDFNNAMDAEKNKVEDAENS